MKDGLFYFNGMAIVYRHRKITNGEVFYIGIGKSNERAKSKNNRSKYWKSVVKKYGYVVEILLSELSWEDACELEILLIQEYGRKDLGLGNLVNLTNGGEGILGYCHSKQAKDKLSFINSNRSESTRAKISLHRKGTKASEEAKKNMSLSRLGRITSEITKIKLADISRNRDPEITKRIADSHKKLILNTQTGIYYIGLKEAAFSIGMKEVTLGSKLRGLYTNNTYFMYV